jgi:alpha-tubulin suppressor-like RCC1 family protein
MAQGSEETSRVDEAGLRLQTRAIALSLLFFAFTGLPFAQTAFAVGGSVVAWGSNDYGERNVPASATNIVALAAGPVHTLALTEDHTLLAWGASDVIPPPGISNLVTIAASGFHSMGIRPDRSLWVWSPQAPVANFPASATNLIKVSAGNIHVMALRADGQVIAWGENFWGATDVPDDATNIVDIAAGGMFSVGLRSDGAVLVWPGRITLGVSNIVSIAATYYDCLALRSDGHVFVGDSDSGLSNIVAVAGGGAGHWLALRKDGTVVAVGSNSKGQSTIPSGLSNVSAIAAGSEHSLALVNVPGLQIQIPPRDQTVLAGENVLLSCEARGTMPLTYVWTRNGNQVAQTSMPFLLLPGAQPVDSGLYRTVVTNSTGSITSSPANVTVVATAPRIGLSITNLAVLPGANASISADVSGTEPMFLQWQKDGVHVPLATNRVLSLSNATWSDAGSYRLFATNITGTTLSERAVIAVVQAGVWGSPDFRHTNVPPSATNLVAIAVGSDHILALHEDGTLIAWGGNYWGQCDIPPRATNIVSIDAEWGVSIALSADGTPIVWGDNSSGQTNVPPSASNAIAVATGSSRCAVVRQDGRVVAWGNGQTNVPATATNVIGLSLGDRHSLVLRADGSVVAWGDNGSGQATVSPAATNVIAVAAGSEHSLALRHDGTAVAWGNNYSGQCNVPAGASNLVAIAASGAFSMALQADGSVIGWGDDTYGRTVAPLLVTNVNTIAAGGLNAALVDRGAFSLFRQPLNANALAGDTLILLASAFGRPMITYQWLFNGAAISGATNARLVLPNVQQVNVGDYAVAATSGLLSQTSHVAVVAVAPRAPIIVQQPTNQPARPGGLATFAVSAIGTEPLSFQWMFDGTNLLNATNSTLTLTNVQLVNGGDYQVILTNSLGVVTSALARLEIYPFNLLSVLTNATGTWSADWGDYDNDGRLDLLVGGKAGGQPSSATAHLFRNLGNGNFTEINVGFAQSAQSVAWGDFDNDGFLDILLVRSSDGKIWRNKGDGTFTNLNLTLTADLNTVASLVDFNGDGRLDILLGGRLYRNLGNDQFTNVSAGLPTTQYSTTAWGDYDGDGRPDVLICGLVGANAQFRLYRNLGNGTFTNVSAGFQDIYRGMGAWFDFDGDGRLDVLMSGQTGPGVRFTALYRNNGDGTFTNVSSGLPATSYAWLAIGDGDNDGQPDVFLSGNNGTNSVGRLFRGQTNGSFVQVVSPFPTNLAPVASWGDYDLDGRLDLALSTLVSGQANVGLYRNDATITNTPPSPPSAVAAFAGVNSVTFQWGAGNDGQTPTSSLTYGLRVGRSPGLNDVLAPDAATNGTRRVARPGNAGWGRSLTITNLAFGRYYWAVQSVDSAFAGSPFTPEQIFTYAAATLPATAITSSEATLNGTLDTNRLPAVAWFEWGTTTNHGNTTTLQNIPTNATGAFLTASIAGLLPGTTYYCRLVVTNLEDVYYGGEQSFITTDLPHIVPLAASGITASNATINALVNPNGASTGVAFEYGLTRSYGISTSFTNIGSGRRLVSVSRTVGGLIGGQVYHFRVVATNDVGAAYTADLTFTTSTEPEAVTLAASNVGPTSATLNASVRPNTLPTDVIFEHGVTTNLGSVTPATNLAGGTNMVTVAMPVSGLTRLTTYYFRVAASNATGMTRGAIRSFKTTNDVIALPPANVTMTTATLNGLVNPNGLQTSVAFEFGPTTNFGNTTPGMMLSGGTNLTSVSYDVAGLLSNSTYFFRVMATNADGARQSTALSFQMLPLFSVIDLGLAGAVSGSAAWGDYDNDGRLDLLVASQSVTRLYRNLGNGSFATVSTSITGTASGSVAWGDYNNDGWLDVLVVGTSTGGPISRIYRNDGNGTFTDIQAGLQPVGFGVGRWGDFNNDGRQDVLLVGETAKIFRNDGNGVFTDMNVALPAYLDAHAATVDYDNDGRLDVLLMGRVGIPYADVYAKLYRNMGDGTFQDSGAVLPGVRLGFADCGDFDGDGFPDLLYGGGGANLSDVLYLYRNNGNGTFSNLSSLVPQFAPDAALWGDYDADGRPDIFVRGQKYISSIVPSNSYSAILHNNGTNAFTYTYFPLPEIWSSAGGLNDYDADGRLDIAITGNSRTGAILRFYRNNWPMTNTPPSAPQQQTNAISGNTITFSWARGSDLESPIRGLTYNLRVGRYPGGADVVSPLSGSSGVRRVAAPGNVGEATTFTLTNVKPGRYYWSVQTVDASFAGSQFAAEQIAMVTGVPRAFTLGPTNLSGRSAVLVASVCPNGDATTTYFEWGTTTNLGTATEPVLLPADFVTNQISALLANLLPEANYYYRVVASNAVGVAYGQQRQVQAVFPPSLSATLVLGNTLQINFTGSVGASYGVYASTNLVNWVLVGQASGISSNLFRFVDFLNTNHPARFYRVSAP